MFQSEVCRRGGVGRERDTEREEKTQPCIATAGASLHASGESAAVEFAQHSQALRCLSAMHVGPPSEWWLNLVRVRGVQSQGTQGTSHSPALGAQGVAGRSLQRGHAHLNRHSLPPLSRAGGSQGPSW